MGEHQSMNLTIPIHLYYAATAPTKAHDTDAGWDCYANDAYLLERGIPERVCLGFRTAIPEGWYAQLREKSGVATGGLHIMGGVIDSGFRGEWHAIVVWYGWDVMVKTMWRLSPAKPFANSPCTGFLSSPGSRWRCCRNRGEGVEDLGVQGNEYRWLRVFSL